MRDYGTARWEGGDATHKHDRIAARNGRGGSGPPGKQTEGAFLSDFPASLCYCGARRVDAQMGIEAVPDCRGWATKAPCGVCYVCHMVAVFREVRRVLRDDGTCWLTLGDSYNSSPSWGRGGGSTLDGGLPRFRPGASRADGVVKQESPRNRNGNSAPGLKPKDLMMMPARVALALQADGWWLRSDIVWCLSGGTYLYVKSQKGEMPMMVRDMARLDPSTVSLWNGTQWTKVRGWNKSARRGDELELVLRSGERISCTGTHQWPTQRGLLAAADLRRGDILKQSQLPEPLHSRDAASINEEVAWFLGLYLAEGSRGGKDKIQITGNADELRWVDRLRSIAATFGASVTFTFSVDGNTLNIRLYGRVLSAVIDDHIGGRTAHDKGLKVRCWSYGNLWLRRLLDGYLEGDGHWEPKNKRWLLGFTRNYNLERDLRVLSSRLGAVLTLNLSTATSQDGEFPSFRGELRFAQSGHRNEKPRTEIVEIRNSRCRAVYDIGVEDEPHVYALASGVLTHNSKPNPMPESVKGSHWSRHQVQQDGPFNNDLVDCPGCPKCDAHDGYIFHLSAGRPTRSHEDIFLLTKSARYFYDADAIAEPLARPNEGDRKTPARFGGANKFTEAQKQSRLHSGNEYSGTVTGTRNKRDSWRITPQPFKGAHFATFPQKLVEPCVLAGTSERGCCVECGAPWVRVRERVAGEPESYHNSDFTKGKTGINGMGRVSTAERTTSRSIGWRPSCSHNAPTRPCLVLDPFAGSGTVGVVCNQYDRRFVGMDLSAEYVNLAKRRVGGDLQGLNVSAARSTAGTID